ncbi:hypothetical protein [Streptomyces sp. NPDC008121]
MTSPAPHSSALPTRLLAVAGLVALAWVCAMVYTVAVWVSA